MENNLEKLFFNRVKLHSVIHVKDLFLEDKVFVVVDCVTHVQPRKLKEMNDPLM